MRTQSLLLSAVLLSSASALQAQGYVPWLQSRIDARIAARRHAVETLQTVANGKGIDKEKQTPAADDRSTALVDQSSASDLVSVAVNLVPIGTLLGPQNGSSSTSGSSGSGSATATLYALMASAHGSALSDTAYYASHANARRLSFSAGTTASTQATDNSTGSAAVLGTKAVLFGFRDLFVGRGKKAFNDLAAANADFAVAVAPAYGEIPDRIAAATCPQIPLQTALLSLDCFDGRDFVAHTLPKIPPSTLTALDAFIDAHIVQSNISLQDQINQAYDAIKPANQVSLAYTGTLRTGNGYNGHRGVLIADFSAKKPLSFTVNASVDFTDRKSVAANSTGGRFATEMQYQAVRSAATSTRSSLTISFAGEGDWMTRQKPEYTGQAKVSIPVGPGLNLPIAYQYANRAAQLDQSNSQLKLGLTVDMAKIVQSLKLGL